MLAVLHQFEIAEVVLSAKQTFASRVWDAVCQELDQPMFEWVRPRWYEVVGAAIIALALTVLTTGPIHSVGVRLDHHSWSMFVRLLARFIPGS